MGVDFYPCEICNETFCDCGGYYYCASCEGMIGPCCYEEQVEKYGSIDENHDSALQQCDSCVLESKREELKENLIKYLKECGEWELTTQVETLF